MTFVLNFCYKLLFPSFVHNFCSLCSQFFMQLYFTTLVHRSCSHLLFTTFVHKFCLLFFSQVLFTTYVHNLCSQNFCSQLLFITVSQICTQLLFEILYHNFCSQLLVHNFFNFLPSPLWVLFPYTTFDTKLSWVSLSPNLSSNATKCETLFSKLQLSQILYEA